MINYLKAGFRHFFIRSEEMDYAITWIKDELSNWRKDIEPVIWGYSSENPDPLAPLMEVENSNTKALILKNYHWFLKDQMTGNPNYETIQFIQDRLKIYRSPERRTILIIVSNLGMNEALPEELKREFVEIPHALPNTKEIGEILNETIEVAEEYAKKEKKKFTPLKDETKARLIESAKGMTRFMTQNSFYLSLAKSGELDPEEVFKMRSQFLSGVAGVKYIKYTETFKDLIGVELLKDFALRGIYSDLAKGIVLLGPPGTGKSHFAKALAGETGFMMLTIEMAEWQGGIVGETESRVRKAIEACLALAPTPGSGAKLILFIDEMEKGMSGAGRGGGITSSSDPITKRAMGQWLKFMQEKPSTIYPIATVNEVDDIPGEHLRAERWDTAPFFIDLPNTEECDAIIKHYSKDFDWTEGGKFKANKVTGILKVSDCCGGGWTGAEIRACCRLSAMLGIPLQDAKNFIKPISLFKKEQIDRLRKEAEVKYLLASKVIPKKMKREVQFG